MAKTNAPAQNDEWEGMDEGARKIAELKKKAQEKAKADPDSPEAKAGKPDPTPKIAPEKPKVHKQTGKPVIQAAPAPKKTVTVPGEAAKVVKQMPKTPEEIANAAAEKARVAALKEAEKAAAAKAKADKEKADKKAKEDHDRQVKADLDQKAKAVNVRMEKVQKLDGDMQDHRLAAALELAAAKKICDENKIKFADWHKDNITVNLSYDEARKLVAVGSSEDPKAALADLRAGAAARNKKLRDKKKKKTEEQKKAKKTKPKARPEGSKQEIDLSEDAGKLREQFEALSGSDQEDFLQWAAESIGATVEFAS